MQTPDYAIGQAIYLRTDVPDYPEVAFPIQTVGELVRICSAPKPDMLLDKVVFYATIDEETRSVALSFLSASKGARPATIAPRLIEK